MMTNWRNKTPTLKWSSTPSSQKSVGILNKLEQEKNRMLGLEKLSFTEQNSSEIGKFFILILCYCLRSVIQ